MKLLEILIFNKLKNRGGGITPTGTINITTNGEHDVTQYATANVNVVSEYNAKMSTTKPTGFIANYGIKYLITEIPEIDFTDFPSGYASNFFAEFRNLKEIKVKNMPNPTGTKGVSYMFQNCTSLLNVVGLNTNGCSRFGYMFSGCLNLVNIPDLDLSNATQLNNIFFDCNSLSNESLNKILGYLISATSYTDTKTLKYIGLSSAQATTCTGLSNWADAQTAGWTTGY